MSKITNWFLYEMQHWAEMGVFRTLSDAEMLEIVILIKTF